MVAQVTIKNPDGLEVPELRAQLVFSVTCEVVASEFHVKRAEAEFPIILVLGEPNERYTSDEEHQLYTLYLYRWNEAQFAASAMRLALQHIVTQTRRDRMVKEILKRSDKIGIVSAKLGTKRSMIGLNQ